MNRLYFCCDERRRQAVRQHSTLNGIDFLEVVDRPTLPNKERQRLLRVHFIKPLDKNYPLDKSKVRIEGGERVRDVAVVAATSGKGKNANLLRMRVDKPGDFSTYTLRLVQDDQSDEPPAGYDPILSAVDFSFKVECPSDFDCRKQRICPPESLDEPEIDYLSKDYASFRQLMFDRLAVLMPNWKERNPADVGMALVELLAYVGDYLSYQQDAIATEAYLGTARRRVSARRHARLVDYFMHDGCNARVWVQLQVNENNVTLKKGSQLLTRVSGLAKVIAPNTLAYDQALAAKPEVFETMHEVTLFSEHNQISFYTWGARQCCLPKGATRAALAGRFTHLKKGDVLLFEEVLGPQTGEPEDADPTHRHIVRLSKDPRFLEDPLFSDPDDPTQVQPVTEIEWDLEDALPFPLCISATTDEEHGRQYLEAVSLAGGNMVLADHGRTIENESLGTVSSPDPRLAIVQPPAEDRCEERELSLVYPRFRPRLQEGPLTQAATVTKTEMVDGQERRLFFDPEAPASLVFRWEMERVLPVISLEDSNGIEWLPQRDLLSSDEFAPEFVAEVEEDGRATLRFGDGQYGLRPSSDVSFVATYRLGNGVRGNVGAEALVHIVSDDNRIESVRNPLPAKGGIDPESIDQVRQSAPGAFRIQQRAVTPEDYAEAAERHSQVQRAAATVRWTGSWRTIFLTVDRLGGQPVDAEFEGEMRRHLERYRMAGHDVEIDGPQFVPLEIEMRICVQPDYFRSDIQTALLEVFSNRILPDGRRGFFHADKFSFGQPVYLSKLYAAAQAVAGVRFVEFIKFQRFGIESQEGLDAGLLEMDRLEIAQLDNDPNFPERGVLRLIMEGGR
jgi:hypothetical protein